MARMEHMGAAEQARPESANRAHSRVDTLAALVLSIAAVATAWSAYQSSRWSGIMAGDYNQASALRSESVRADTAAGQAMVIDVTLASDWANAQLNGQQELADDLRVRMTPQLSAAMNSWLAGWVPGAVLPQGSPFSDGRYVAPGREHAAQLEQQATTTFKAGSKANQRSDNYVLTGVLFALALFFAGISSQMQREAHSRRLVYAASFIMFTGLLLLVLQPKSFSI
jgi:hypothetical protein